MISREPEFVDRGCARPINRCIWVLAVVTLVAACGPGPTPATVSTHVAPAAPTFVALEPAAATSLPTPLPSPTLTRPAATLSPMPLLAATVEPSPTALPLPLEIAADAPVTRPLEMSLGWRLDGNAHLSAAIAGPGGGSPAFFVSSLSRTVYALKSDGRVQWRAQAPGAVYALAALPAGHVAAAGEGGVSVLNAQGRTVWRYNAGTRLTALQPDGQGGLLCGGWDNRLTSLAADGTVRWQAEVGAPVMGIALMAGPDLAVVGTAAGEVRAISAAGQEVWRVVLSSPVTGVGPHTFSGGTVSDIGRSRVLVSGQAGRLAALDEAGRVSELLPASLAGEGGPVWTAVEMEDGQSGLLIGEGRPARLDLVLPSGAIAWRASLPAPAGGVAAVRWGGEPVFLAGLANGEVRAYDAHGRLRARLDAGLPVSGLVAAGDRALALADVVAWEIRPRWGTTGRPWLKVPALVPPDAEPSLPFAAQAEDSEPQAILAFLGDVVPGRSMEAQLERHGPAYPWAGLAPLLRQADLAVANLECVLTTGGTPMSKQYLIRAHPRWGQMLPEAGIDLVQVANNHLLDMGPVGLDDTLVTVRSLGVQTVGAGASAAEASRPALYTLNGIRVAVLAYAAARWNGSADVPATDRIAWAEPERVQADVRAVRGQADVVVVLLHAGTEYAARPSADQVTVAHGAINAGADLVVGSHPHVTQTVERYGHGLIVYSLGDALFDIPRQAAMQGDLLWVRVTRGGLRQAELWPFWIDGEIQPRLLAAAADPATPRVSIVFPEP